ncbi:hypothetical protein XACW160_500070 [Xanthomonas citri pv. citri]|nr:hypothetical protein XACW160_500070 [Xanthomonas citri pv. citri]CEH72027.1 hypothetical protein XAC3612_1770009 [Xanthomonas citri pv. citri]CEH72123.1 hypothetical protein XACLH37_1770008 [Xanthomonas citri pv. citri]
MWPRSMADLRPKHRFVLARHSPVVSELQRRVVGADLARPGIPDDAPPYAHAILLSFR